MEDNMICNETFIRSMTWREHVIEAEIRFSKTVTQDVSSCLYFDEDVTDPSSEGHSNPKSTFVVICYQQVDPHKSRKKYLRKIIQKACLLHQEVIMVLKLPLENKFLGHLNKSTNDSKRWKCKNLIRREITHEGKHIQIRLWE